MVFAALTGAPCHSFASELEGIHWRFTQLGNKNVGIAGDIRFENGAISGATACNHFGGTYKRSGTIGISIKVGRMTRRGCSGPAAELERGVLEALAKTNSFKLNSGGLALRDSETTVASLTPMAIQGLESGPLKIVSFLKDGGLHSIPVERQTQIKFSGGKFEGNTGCTTVTGTYTIDGDKIAIKVAGAKAAKSPCPDEFTDQDAAIRANLAKSYRFDSYRNLIRVLQQENDWAVLWLTPVGN